MKARYHTSADKRDAARAAANHILDRLKALLAKQDSATLAVSGGSTPQLMFEQLAAQEFDWKGVHIFWVDERCVPPAHPDSNYGMTQRALLNPLGISSEQVHRVEGELSPEQAAERYIAQIREFFQLDGEALPHFDVVHLGMGADAHTASLFPGDPLIHDRKQIAGAVYAGSRDSYRVTLMPGVLFNAAETLFLVTGNDKAETVRAVFQKPFDPLIRPAQLLAHQGQNVQWFLDRAAAAALG